jgi:hypothetical protein
MTRAEEIAEIWLAHDRRAARDAREAAAMELSRAARVCIVELWLESSGASSDGHGSFAQLGRILADEQVSCASALACVTSFARILPAPEDANLAAARSALADAFVEARVEHERLAARAKADGAWMQLAPRVAAIVANPPDDDAEWLQDWADRLAAELLRHGIRNAFVRAPDPARAAVRSALSLIGIEVVTEWPAPPVGLWRRLIGS